MLRSKNDIIIITIINVGICALFPYKLFIGQLVWKHRHRSLNELTLNLLVLQLCLVGVPAAPQCVNWTEQSGLTNNSEPRNKIRLKYRNTVLPWYEIPARAPDLVPSAAQMPFVRAPFCLLCPWCSLVSSLRISIPSEQHTWAASP